MIVSSFFYTGETSEQKATAFLKDNEQENDKTGNKSTTSTKNSTSGLSKPTGPSISRVGVANSINVNNTATVKESKAPESRNKSASLPAF